MKRIASLILIIVIILICVIIANYKEEEIEQINVNSFNLEYEEFNKESLNGLKVATVINKAIDLNELNEIPRDEKGFYILDDELTGDFDKNRAEQLINDMASISDVTGNPYIVQVFGQTVEALPKYIEYVGDICDAPFLIDSTSGDARVAGAQYSDETGLTERAIYNSINMAADKSELDALAETDLLRISFSESLWNTVINHVTVYADERLVFHFKNGARQEVSI